MKLPLSPTPLHQLLAQLKPADLAATVDLGPLVGGRYLHWDELRHRTPPNGLTHAAWWTGIKLARHALLRELPLRDKHGKPMRVGIPDPVLQALHAIDRQAAGTVEMHSPVVSPEDRDRYLVSALIEEAVTSSQLEGAATTSVEAKTMLRSGRKPHDRSEQMILNNFRVMEHIRELRDEPLSPAHLLELHRIVTTDTLDDATAAGRLRRPGETIRVVDTQRAAVLHDPPEATTLPERLERLCAFANGNTQDAHFIHPVIRAILLHFMLGYDHPFVDGNGRTARALFYWSMARSGYWLTEYLSISRLLKKAPAKYTRAYLHAETDENDTTYFVIHQLETLERAIQGLHDYLSRKAQEQHSAESLLRHAPEISARLNHRQVALLSHALRHAGHGYTVESHRRSHRITPQTARTDLADLADLGLLEQRKRGRAYVFFAQPDLHERLRAAAERIPLPDRDAVQ